MSCSLAIFGRALDAAHCAASFADIQFDTIICQGQPIEGRENPADYGLLTVVISSAEDEISQQAEEAMKFLDKHASQIFDLQQFPEVQEVYLDFTMQSKGTLPAFGRFPAALLRAASELGLSIEVTVLPGGAALGDFLFEFESEVFDEVVEEVRSPFLSV